MTATLSKQIKQRGDLVSNATRFHMEKEHSIIKTLSQFDPRAYECARRFFAKIGQPLKQAKESSHYICGIVGSGKTVMALNLVHDITRQRYAKGCPRVTVAAVKYFALLQEIKCTFDKDSSKTTQQVLDKYMKADILLIDDIGTSPVTDWGYTHLYMIVDYRYSHNLITLYTSNLSIAQLAGIYADDRIPSRIQHDCGENIYELSSKSRR